MSSIKSSTNTQVTEHPDNPESLDVISRAEIINKRKQIRKQKREENRIKRENEKLQQKLSKTSEKVQILTPERFQKLQENLLSPSSSTNNYKLQKHQNHKQKKFHQVEEFNLVDFVVKKQKQCQKPLRRLNTKKNEILQAVKLHRGKKREIPKKKHYSRLRRVILKNRLMKKGNQLTENIVENSVQSELDGAAKQAISSELPQETATYNEQNLTEKLESLQITTKKSSDLSKKIHSRKFRPYCDNTTSKELCDLTENLIRDIFRFQKRAYENNQIKAIAHKRYVVGFNEVKKKLSVNKVKLIVFAPDCESCELPDGINDTINKIKMECNEKEIPYLFALNRRHLGYLLFIKGPVSCVGILNYDGAQNTFHSLMNCLQIERKRYQDLTTNN